MVSLRQGRPSGKGDEDFDLFLAKSGTERKKKKLSTDEMTPPGEKPSTVLFNFGTSTHRLEEERGTHVGRAEYRKSSWRPQVNHAGRRAKGRKGIIPAYQDGNFLSSKITVLHHRMHYTSLMGCYAVKQTTAPVSSQTHPLSLLDCCQLRL